MTPLRAALVLALTGLLVLPAGASAAFHFMKVSEVYAGDTTDPGAHFIELQMYSPNQTVVSGHTVTAFGPAGDEEYVFEENVANGQSQRTILIATAEAEAKFGVTADLAMEKLALDRSSGAACFDAIDCVAWGPFAGGALLSPTGTNAAAIPNGMSLARSIAPGCETLLESSDDSNDSATDFFGAVPSPRSNATAPTETECTGPGPGPDTTVDGARLTAKAKQRTSRRKPAVVAKAKLGEEGRVKVVAKAKVGKRTYTLKKSASLQAADAKKIKLKSKGKPKRKLGGALKQGRKVKVKLSATFTDEAGNKSTERTKTKLK